MVALAVVLWRMASTGGPTTHEDEPQYTNFLAKVNDGSVKDAVIYLSPNSAELKGDYKDGTQFANITIAHAAIPDVAKVFQDHNILFNYKEVKNPDWIGWLTTLLPMLLLVGLWIF